MTPPPGDVYHGSGGAAARTSGGFPDIPERFGGAPREAAMLFRRIYDDNLAHAAYLIGCQRTGEAILIDPARDVDRYLAAARDEGLRIVAATETHIHADFLSGTRELAELGAVHLYLSKEGGPDWQYGWAGGYDHTLVGDGDTIRVGNIELRVVHTPGHTPEHVTFLVVDHGGGADEPMGALTGDFVFVGDVGRPDLLETAAGIEGAKEASAIDLARSTRKFLELPDHLQVWPAHGAGSACGKALGAVPQSTVGYERRFNPALVRASDEGEFTRFVLEGQPEPPLYFARMKKENRDGAAVLGPLPKPDHVRLDDALQPGGDAFATIDVRSWDAFRAAHIPGSIYAPLTSAFHSYVGSYVTPDQEVRIVAPEGKVEAVVRELVRIGLDRVRGYVNARDIEDRAGLASIDEITVEDLAARLQAEPEAATVVDVRRAAERAGGGIWPDAVEVAHTRLPEALDRVPCDKPVYVHCATGKRSAAAAAYLRSVGVDAINVAGGYTAWLEAGLAHTAGSTA